MRVDLPMIRYYTGHRLADVTTFRAIGILMDKVSEVSWIQAPWGELPWSPYWANAWKSACQQRRQDANSAHDAFLNTANRMLQAAATYYHTDINASVTFTQIDQDLAWYLAPGEQDNHSAGTFHPGGGYTYNGRRTFIPGPWKYWGEGPVEGSPTLKGSYDFMCPPLDDLSSVLADNGPLLQEVENRLDSWDVNNPHLYSQYLVPANKADPPVIKAYAEEVLHAANVYHDLLDVLKKDNHSLAGNWIGTAGQTAVDHVQNLYNYVQSCYNEALWLGQTGDQCATVLANLRSGYARVTRNHIEAINTAYKEVAGLVLLLERVRRPCRRQGPGRRHQRPRRPTQQRPGRLRRSPQRTTRRSQGPPDRRNHRITDARRRHQRPRPPRPTPRQRPRRQRMGRPQPLEHLVGSEVCSHRIVRARPRGVT